MAQAMGRGGQQVGGPPDDASMSWWDSLSCRVAIKYKSPVTFRFLISVQRLGHPYATILLVAHRKFKGNWASCIVT